MRRTSQRRDRLRATAAERGLDAVLVTNLLNIRYLTGFTGSNAALLVAATGDEATVFCTDGRYETQAERQVPGLQRLIDRQSDLALAAAAAERGQFTLGFESHRVSVDQHAALQETAPKVDWTRAPGLVEALRVIKDDGEVEALRMACAAADRALADSGGSAPDAERVRLTAVH